VSLRRSGDYAQAHPELAHDIPGPALAELVVGLERLREDFTNLVETGATTRTPPICRGFLLCRLATGGFVFRLQFD
jgi:hypothetical protein